MKICCFFGHSKFSPTKEIENNIKNILIDLIENKSYDTFYLGGKGLFDYHVAEYLYTLKATHPHIKTYLILAYLNQKLDEFDKRKIERLYDETIYPPIEHVPLRYAISKRNQWIINSSDFCIFYLDHAWGGAFKTYEYAKKKIDHIILGNLNTNLKP